MASGVYNRCKYNLAAGLMDLTNGGDTIRVALLDNSHSFDPDDDLWTDVSANEIAGSGYTANGEALTSQSLTQNDTLDKAVFDAADTEWTSATFSAYHAVLYDDTLSYSGGGDDLIASIDFGGEKSVSSGTFTIQWAGTGILTLS